MKVVLCSFRLEPPSKPSRLTAVRIDTTSVMIEWDEPSILGGRKVSEPLLEVFFLTEHSNVELRELQDGLFKSLYA
ncbi:unnamed protein product [Toxocara canis]|uniref:Fibronectin type-III domain-containing protein n=1 Tax=Toxocara canis TaxID=6265 RepID=A0A183U9U0_TOXCA|nr:unnamed protein product [Toxocara canis]